MTYPAVNPVRERHWVCARRMRERRLAQGLTQRELVGRLARCGVATTNRAISTMENGRGLDLGLLPELADVLECTVTYLLGLSSDPHSWRPDHLLRLPDRTDGHMLVSLQRTVSTTSDGGENGPSANN